jgi:hypothetical protein
MTASPAPEAAAKGKAVIKPNNILTRDAILAADDIRTETVEVPEWGGSVIVKGMTGQQRDSFEEAITAQRGKDYVVNFRNFRSKLIVRCVVDENGVQLFGPTDVEALGKKSAAALQRVFKVAQKLSGLGDDEVEELTRELGEDQSAGSGTD